MNLHTFNRHDEQDNPAGGFVVAVTDESTFDSHIEFAEFDATRRTSPAIYIRWQDGPLVKDGTRTEQNGAFVEDVIRAAVQRIEWYQGTDIVPGKFRCEENDMAIGYLRAALTELRRRTERRTLAGVEGTTELD